MSSFKNLLVILSITAFAGVAGLYALEEYCDRKSRKFDIRNVTAERQQHVEPAQMHLVPDLENEESNEITANVSE